MFEGEAMITRHLSETDIKPEEHEEEVIEYIKEVERKKHSLGRGKTSEVFYCKTNPRICYKIIYSKEHYLNDVLKEGEFLSEAVGIESGVKIPKPYYSVMDAKDNYHVLVMETLNAFSVDDLLNNDDIKLPESFDYKNFFRKLREFFKKLHDKKIFHRDVHAGNIMIDRETGEPYVIDFGTAKKAVLSEENIYRDTNGKGELVVYSDDFDGIGRVQTQVRNYILEKRKAQ